MIKFFRKIRQKLLSENKFGKYLTYAIGEIILVVIGILIALYINNRNEDRIANIKSDNYLSALITELDRNILSLESRAKGTRKDIESNANSLKLLNLPEAKNYSDSIIGELISTRPVYSYPLFKSTFNDLINAGVLENITNTDLKNKILSIEPLIENCYETSRKAVDAWDNYQLPYMLKNNNVSNNWNSISGVEIYKPSFERNNNAFIQNFEFANILTLRMRMMGNLESQLEYTKEQFLIISDAIKEHLND